MACMLFVVILSSLLGFSTSAKEPLSIDCGSSDPYTDSHGKNWVADKNYVKNGDSKVAPSANSLNHVMDTLRLFKTNSTNNCYSVKVDKGEKAHVRANFYYGNYDGKLAPPSFDLQLNGIYWDTVKNDLSTDTYMYSEAILVVPDGDISVCLIQTIEGQYPFISALEVQSLEANMYSHVDAHLFLYMRARFSASTTDQIWYPDDVYDRVWLATTLAPTISNSLLTIDVVKAEDNPPESALRNAVTSSATGLPVEISENLLPKVAVPVYMNMYFAELELLDSTDKRSFHVFIDDKRITSTPIVPTYGSVEEITFTNVSASSATVFALKATLDSTLPPIINAFELFIYSSNPVNNSVSKEHSETGSVPKSNGANNSPHASLLAMLAIMGVLLLVDHSRNAAT